MTTKSEPKFKRGCLSACLNYMAQRPNKAVTVDELVRATGWERAKVMHALAESSWNRENGSRNTNPLVLNIEKLGVGIWRWVSVADETAAQNGKKPSEQNDKPSYREVGVTVEPVTVAGQHVSVPSQGFRREMIIEVLKERDTYLLVEDLADGKIYKMTLVG